MIKSFLTDFSLWLLSAIIFIILIISILIITHMEPSFINIPYHANRIPLLASIPISCGVLIAILTFLRERKKQIEENAQNRAKFYLEIAKDGFDEVYELLKDKNNNRVTWIRAARVLLQTRALSFQIKSDYYNKAFLQLEERVRNELYRVLSIAGENGEKEPLPPQFYYGIKDWSSSTNLTLDDVAIQVSNRTTSHSVNINTVPPEPSLKALSSKSIIAIYNFLEYPEDYVDPLDEIQEWEENWQNSFGISRGARRFVTHNRENYVVNGTLHRRSN